MALPITGVPYYKLRAKIIHLAFFFLLLEIAPDEFPAIGNYGEELLEELKERPVAINSCRLEELLRLPGVDEELAQAILKEREERGRFESSEKVVRLFNVFFNSMSFSLTNRLF